jgi:hypothetical protein
MVTSGGPLRQRHYPDDRPSTLIRDQQWPHDADYGSVELTENRHGYRVLLVYGINDSLDPDSMCGKSSFF